MILRLKLIAALIIFITCILVGNIQAEYHLKDMPMQNEVSQIEETNFKAIEEERLNTILVQDQLIVRQQQIIIIALVFLILFIFTVAFLWIKYYTKNKRMISVLQELNDQVFDQNYKILKQKEDLDEAHKEILKANESLEKQIMERTKKLVSQNQKLKEYSFSNSHLVRSPLSRILGIASLLKAGELTDFEQGEFINNLHLSAKELDEIIINLNAVLKEQESSQ